MASVDETLFRSLNLAGINPAIDVLMLFFTTLGAAYVIVFVAVPLWWRGHRAAAFDALVLLLVVLAATEAINWATAVIRPCTALPDVGTLEPYAPCPPPSDFALPSGHAARAFAMAVLVVGSLRWPAPRLVSALIVAGLVGTSRIYLGLHWPSDVVAGALLGALLAVGFLVVARRLAGYRNVRDRVVRAVGRALSRLAKRAMRPEGTT